MFSPDSIPSPAFMNHNRKKRVAARLGFRPDFFLILGLRIFFQNIKVGRGKKIKIKITKKIFFILSVSDLDRRKKNNKNCLILHCFFIFNFFLNLAIFYNGENKKSQK